MIATALSVGISKRSLLEDYYRPQKDRMAALLGRSLDELWFA